MNKDIKINLPWDFSNALYPCALRNSEENTDRTIVFNIYRTTNLFNKKLIDTKIDYINLLLIAEFHIDI